MFVYGPPGNGKTVISQAIHKLLDGDIAIPHALEVEGSIIRFFDPVNHEPLAEAANDRPRPGRRRRPPLGPLPAADGDGRRRADARVARAELQPDDRLLPGAGAGGRQRRRAGHRRLRPPAVLAARAAEPLDRAAREPRRLPDAADGQKFELPFMTLIVFATNIRPQRAGGRGVPAPHPLQDLRREPDRAEFLQIFENCCAEHGLEFRPRRGRDAARRTTSSRARSPLRGCQPRDLIEQVAVARRVPGRAAGAVDRSCSRPPAQPISSTTSEAPAVVRRRPQHDVPRSRCSLRGGCLRSLVALRRRSRGARRRRASGRAPGPGAQRPHHVAARPHRPARHGPHRRAGAARPRTSPGGRSGSTSTSSCSATVTDGPPYATEWVDENPFERREISVEVVRRARPRGAATRSCSSRSRSPRRPR